MNRERWNILRKAQVDREQARINAHPANVYAQVKAAVGCIHGGDTYKSPCYCMGKTFDAWALTEAQKAELKARYESLIERETTERGKAYAEAKARYEQAKTVYEAGE